MVIIVKTSATELLATHDTEQETTYANFPVMIEQMLQMLELLQKGAFAAYKLLPK